MVVLDGLKLAPTLCAVSAQEYFQFRVRASVGVVRTE